jgi:AcrR family transcriptional regulator
MPDLARRSERSRLAILAAARELLTQKDYAELTIEAIAARAGVGKQTIYRWWGGKGAVILDALVETAAEVTLPDTGDLRADLTTVVRAIVAELADPRLSATTRALTIETMGDDVLAAQVRDRLLRPQLDAVKARLRAGHLRPGVDLDQAVELLVGPPFHRWLMRTGPLDDEYADGVVELALAALT